MRVTVTVKQFLPVVQACQRVAVSLYQGGTSGVLLATDGKQWLRLAATDGEGSLRVRVPARTESPGRMLLPARLLTDIVKQLPAETLDIEAEEDGSALLRSGGVTVKLRTMPELNFPNLPDPPADTDRVLIPAGVFANTVQRVACAASRDETRPILTGVMVSADVENSRLSMVATDSYRLAIKHTPLIDPPGEGFITNIPLRALETLVRTLTTSTSGDGDDSGDGGRGPMLAIAVRGTQVVFEAPDGTIVSSRLIDGQYPQYEQLLPEKPAQQVPIPTSLFADTVKRIGVLAASKTSPPLRLLFTDGQLTVSANTPDVGYGTETLPVPYQGDPLEMGFNAGFLRDGLEQVQTGEVLFKASTPVQPAVLEPTDQDDGYLYLIMPIRL